MTNEITNLPEWGWTYEQHVEFRDAWDAKLAEVRVLNDEAGRLRAVIDNLQAAKKSAPTIVEILTADGFDRFALMFPSGLRANGNPVRPDETAISVISRLVSHAMKVENQRYQHEQQSIELTILLARSNRALAEYAIRAVDHVDSSAEVTE